MRTVSGQKAFSYRGTKVWNKFNNNMKVKVKLRFSAPSAGIAEIAKRSSSPRPLVITLKGAGGISKGPPRYTLLNQGTDS